MGLWEFISHGQNLPFFISIVIMLAIALFEVVSLILGLSFSEILDNLIPDFDLEAEVETNVNILSWLNFGKVPFLVLVILFFTTFGLTGFIIQGVFNSILASFVPLFIIIPVTLIITFILIHFFGKILSKIIPQVETTAVKVESLKGKIAEINIGTASLNNPAEAKVKDDFGKTHYVRVVPGDKNEKFSQGEKVVLTILENGVFSAEKVDLDFI